MDRNQDTELPSRPSVTPGAATTPANSAPAPSNSVLASLPRSTHAATTATPMNRMTSSPEWGTVQ